MAVSHDLGRIGPPIEGGQRSLGNYDPDLHIVHVGSADREEPHLEATHVQMCVRCYVGAGCHTAKERQTMADRLR